MAADPPSDPTTQVDSARHTAQETYLFVGSEDGFAAFLPLPRVGRISIGRSSDCDVHIDHPTVSRRHAEIAIDDDTIRIRDLGSANGTHIGARRLEPERDEPLALGQPARVGSSTLIVQRSSTPASIGPGTGQRYVATRLREECARGSRSGGRFAFVRIEVRGAPPVGRLEDALGEELRLSDVVAAVAPGCHEIVLVDSDPDKSQAAIERIMVRLRALGSPAIVGVAHYPDDGDDAESLIRVARARLSAKDRDALSASPAPPWRALVQQIADSHLSVLIRGETGVGKELCAAEIHRGSRRSAAPFLKLNCAAFTETLLESELFGHERGSFTGAVAAKSGLLESADGGTVFLDEVGDLPIPLQAKLLRVLEDREVRRIGSLEPRRIDVRFVAATNRPLETDIEERRFRRDLLYRLGGVVVEIPPLRERLDELEGLARAFIAAACREMKRDTRPRLLPGALAVLRAHSWPGNIRELRNTVERAVLMCGQEEIGPEHLLELVGDGPTMDRPAPTQTPAQVPPQRSRRVSLNDELAQVERRQILSALEECAGNQTRAAKQLGMSRTTLQKRMDAYGLPRPRGRRK